MGYAPTVGPIPGCGLTYRSPSRRALSLVLIVGGSWAADPMSVGYHMPSRDEIEAQIRAEQAFADAQAGHAEGRVRTQERRSMEGVPVESRALCAS